MIVEERKKILFTVVLLACLLLTIVVIVGIEGRSVAEQSTAPGKSAIIGAVNSLRSGRPVKGAIVEAFPQSVAPGSESFFVRSVKSQADGVFILTDVAASDHVAVAVKKPSYARTVYPDVTVRTRATTSVGKLFLQKGKRFTGKVTRQGDSPIGGASVYAYTKVEKDGVEDIVYTPLITKTKDDGRFRFAHLATGEYLFIVLAKGYAVEVRDDVRVRAYQDPAPVKLTLNKAKRIKGSVKNQKGKPIAEAKIALTYPDDADSGLPSYAEKAIASLVSTETESDGRYTIDHLKEGTYSLTAIAEDFAPKMKHGVAAGAKVNFVLTAGGSVSGRVAKKQDDSPVPNLTVVALAGKGKDARKASAVTGDDGRYKIDHLPPGEFSLSPDTEDMVATGKTEVKIREGREVKRYDFQLSPGAKLTGVVLNSDTKQPIAEAKVVARSKSDYPDPVLERSQGKEAITGLDGRFEIKGLPPGRFSVFAGAKGYAPKRSRYSTTDNLSFITTLVVAEEHVFEPLEIMLAPSGIVTGILIDMNGDPVSGADLTARRDDRHSRARANRKSNEQGEYVIYSVKPGKNYRIVALHPDFTYAISEPFEVQKGKTATVNVLLMRGGSVSGAVFDDAGNPLAKVQVKVYPNDIRNLRIGPKPFETLTTLTDGDGFYRIEHVPAGPATLTADLEGFKLGVLEGVQISEGAEARNMNFRLTKGAFVAGQITNEQGDPIAGASVSAKNHSTNKSATSFPYWRKRTRSNRDGKYKLEGLDNVPLDIYVGHRNYISAKKLSVEPNSEDVDFVLGQTGAISGEVVDDLTSEPISRFTIRLYAKKTWATRAQKTERFTSDVGQFEIDKVKAGAYTIEVSAKGYAPARKDKITVSPAKTTKGVQIRMRQGGRISGYVLRASDNSPIEGAKIIDGELYTLTPIRLSNMPSLEDDETHATSADGSYTLEDLEVGEHTITAFHPDFAINSVKDVVVVQGEATSDVVILLSQGGAIAGTVYDEEGKPQSGALVVIGGEGASARRRTDEAGEYFLRGLVPGAYFLMKTSGAGQTGRKQVRADVKEAEVTIVNFGEAQGCLLYGRVLRSGDPVAGATIILADMPQQLEKTFTTSNEEGSYEIRGLQPGKYSLLAYNATTKASLVVEIPDAPEMQYDINIAETGIAGAVHDAATGEPLEEASVIIQPMPDDPMPRHAAATLWTDEQGRYEMAGLEPGRYRVKATRPGYGAEFLEDVEIYDGRVTSGIDFRLPSGGSIRGAIINAKGKAVPYAFIRAYDSEKSRKDVFLSDTVRANRDGSYLVSGLEEGSYNVTVTATNYASVTKTGVEVVAGEETELDVTLLRSSDVEKF